MNLTRSARSREDCPSNPNRSDPISLYDPRYDPTVIQAFAGNLLAQADRVVTICTVAGCGLGGVGGGIAPMPFQDALDAAA